MKKLLILNVFLIISITLFSQSWKTYPYSPAGSLLSFPIDEGRHSSEPIEWWYTSGHLIGESTGKHYSYMLSYFYSPISIFDGFRIFNLADDDLGLFYNETLPLNYNILATDSLNIEADIYLGGTETWLNKRDMDGNSLPFEYEISAASASGAINLDYNSIKPPLILADSGFLYQGSLAYTYYYSQTKNEVSGTISINGITENVGGTAWIDRQYGTFNPSIGQEYEWFCVQLSNGMDINIYNIFTGNDEIPDTSTFKIFSAYVDETTQYSTSNFEIERLSYSYMQDSLKCYSQKWRITSSIHDVDIIVSTLHSNNEVLLPFRFYEGSTVVSGSVDGNSVTGIGFAELLHSYDKPNINVTDTTGSGDLSTLLTWQLNNPDDGNHLKYDLNYSIDNQQTFFPIIQEIADTFYYWNNPPIPSGEAFWLKVTGYSIDTTIFGSSIAKLSANYTFIKAVENQERINVYPNPSEGQFFIDGRNIHKIEIVDISGKLIYSSSQIQPEQSIDLSAQHKGIYFVMLTTDRGIVTKKLILK